ncbi:epsin-2 isoform X2 [Monodelphis domestica]|uniref:epsin-2 isoform X2 n=1 Tax=Monodelphis domestica TaxID=13616 RepID=UPI0024E1F87E|nr:epsin-2 isoform X2 [Monodelphis domestica]XP_056662726.1 epsin-2 isoform X2 [Monodelphis domestica]XP_056662727.1 epsin-2 isoform X2 [Monodelphis domestica]
MTTSSIRRQMKNIVNNYSEAEIKVREATSNDPWGPSSSLMTEIADLTYNVVAFSEIMSMIWKRLNDHGKNWRHVYKALTLLDYLIKTGSERVAQQCKENIFAIQTLKDFQYIDRDGKDQGINVREKSKQLVSLLKDDERLKIERAQALKTKERMAQVATGVGSNQITFGRGSSQPNLSTSYSEQEYGKSGGSPASYHGSTSPRVSSELEQARPQTSGEEELQLQLALAMSREVAEQEERLRRGDDLRLQMALEESRRDTVKIPRKKEHTTLLDLMDALPSSAAAPQKEEPWGTSTVTKQTDPWGGAATTSTTSDPWQSFGAKAAVSDPWRAPAGSSTQSLPKNTDPWVPSQSASGVAKATTDPWGPTSANKTISTSGSFDLFSNLNGTLKDDFSDFDNLRTSKKTAESISSLPSQNNGTSSPDLFDSQSVNLVSSKQSVARKTPESFLGPNAALVNLDSLITKPSQPVPSLNPFLAPGSSTTPTPVNPFQVNQPQPLTLNQMRASPIMGTSPSFTSVSSVSMEPAPLPSVAPVAVGMAPVPSLGSVTSLTRMGQGIAMAGSLSQPLHSAGIPPPASQATSTTNPFLL